MSPDKSTNIDGYKINEYYWAGKSIVYVDNVIFEGNYDYAMRLAKIGEISKYLKLCNERRGLQMELEKNKIGQIELEKQIKFITSCINSASK